MKKRYLISRCLLGEACRYDGRDKCSPAVCRMDAEFLTVCPETDAGYGIPREPMHVEGDRLITNHTAKDVTSPLLQWTERYLETLDPARLDGVILKRRSPSCDLTT
jgi:uncharacterized protein YbbK (DUF523 family)